MAPLFNDQVGTPIGSDPDDKNHQDLEVGDDCSNYSYQDLEQVGRGGACQGLVEQANLAS